MTIKKIGSGTYVTITKKGEEISTKLLQELIALREVREVNRTSMKSTAKRVDEDVVLLKLEEKMATTPPLTSGYHI